MSSSLPRDSNNNNKNTFCHDDVETVRDINTDQTTIVRPVRWATGSITVACDVNTGI